MFAFRPLQILSGTNPDTGLTAIYPSKHFHASSQGKCKYKVICIKIQNVKINEPYKFIFTTYLEKRRGNVSKDKLQSGPYPDLSPIRSVKV